MALTQFVAQRKLTSREQLWLEKDRVCDQCGSHMLRIAVREGFAPYHWVPDGYRCANCSNVVLND